MVTLLPVDPAPEYSFLYFSITLTMNRSKSKIFRLLLEDTGLLLRPCGYDALSALLIKKAGFRLMGTSGSTPQAYG